MAISKSDEKASVFLSLILRHKPELAHEKCLGRNGYLPVLSVLNGLNENGFPICLLDLQRIVYEDENTRYKFSEDGSLIRANSSHSAPVIMDYVKAEPPVLLFHGTGKKSVDSILANGLEKRGRNSAQLTTDLNEAMRVAKRHGIPVILAVGAKRAHTDGVAFGITETGSWVVDYIHPKYIAVYNLDEQVKEV